MWFAIDILGGKYYNSSIVNYGSDKKGRKMTVETREREERRMEEMWARVEALAAEAEVGNITWEEYNERQDPIMRERRRIFDCLEGIGG